MLQHDGCDVWFAVDDDCEADTETVKRAIYLARMTRGIVLIPYLLRDIRPEVKHTTSVTIAADSAVEIFKSPSGFLPIRAIECLGGGFGLTLLHRDAVLRIRDVWKDWTFLDDDGQLKIPTFAEHIEPGGSWLGEDLSFFARVPNDMPMRALLSGSSAHAGSVLRLEEVPTPDDVPQKEILQSEAPTVKPPAPEIDDPEKTQPNIGE
jgi:hypothetical protein